MLSPPIPGLSGHWRFDEGTGTTAGVEGANGPVVFFTNALWGAGRVGPQSLLFNGGPAAGSGSRAWVSNTNHSVLPAAGRPFGVSLWLSLGAQTIGWQGLIGNAGWNVALHTPSTGTNLIVFTSTALNLSARTLLLPGQWYELTITSDGAIASVYLDANLLARAPGSVTTDNGPIYIGGAIAGHNSFLGRIDEVRTYTNSLTEEQVSLTGHWSFDNTSSTLVLDSSIRGHHARAQNPTWAPGKTGSAANVNSNEITIANEHFTVIPPTAGPFSLSFWLYPHSLLPGRSGLMSSDDGNWELAVETAATGETAICFKSLSANSTLDLRAPVPLSISAWTKLDLTYDGGIATVYVNGRRIHADPGAILSSRSPIRIGRASGAGNFDGLIDELKIYRRARAAFEIGPIATVMWETVLRGSATNFVLQGSGPPGKTLTYSILPGLTPTNGSISHLNGSSLLTYTAGTRKGPDALMFTVSDGEFTSEPATLGLSIVQPHWLSPSGGSVPPLDGSAPEQAWSADLATALDAIWKTNNYYDCFFYAPGVYETSGWRWETRPTAFPGCKHIGSGSEGLGATTIKLVGARESTAEEYIFSPRYSGEVCNAFEVHNLALDCNAENNPKYAQGEPLWLRIPLTATSLVQSITIRWNIRAIPVVSAIPWYYGPAREFRVCARTPDIGGYTTNCFSYVSMGDVDAVPVPALTDEIVIFLDRREPGVDLYSIGSIEITGGSASLPSATQAGGSSNSWFQEPDPAYSSVHLVDNNLGSVWASGPETNVQIALPVDPNSAVRGLRLEWNCQTLPGEFRLGPASEYKIKARRLDTGAYEELSFTRELRAPYGTENNLFTAPVQTDRFILELTARERDVNVYSLREVSPLSGTLLVPTALSASASILRAFDQAPETAYASATQGMIAALDVLGNNLKFTRLKVIGFGTKAGRECFPFRIVNPFVTPLVGNILVEDCLFAEPATNNTEGVTAIVVTGKQGSLTNTVIRRCTIRGLGEHFPGASQGIGANVVENCLIERCGMALYYEPDSAIDDIGSIVIRSNRFVNVQRGVWIQFHPGRRLGPMTFTDNEVVLSPAGGMGFGACDICTTGPSGSISNVVALRNVIRYADWQPRPSNNEMGFHYSDMGHAVFANNIVALGTRFGLRVRPCPGGWVPPPVIPQYCPPHPQPPPSNEQGHFPPCVDVPPPGYRRAWLNNRDLSGALLPVSLWNHNVEGFSSQQQPPGEVP